MNDKGQEIGTRLINEKHHLQKETVKSCEERKDGFKYTSLKMKVLERNGFSWEAGRKSTCWFPWMPQVWSFADTWGAR